MIRHIEITAINLRQKIREKTISLAGNSKLKIYGLLSCTSGKRMKRKNRVFFVSVKEAVTKGYRPCGNCMKVNYQKWKNETIQGLLLPPISSSGL